MSSTKQVHVPSCRKEDCKRLMSLLVENLERQSVCCVWEGRGDYPAGGLYADRFSRFYSECCRTVIHICPEIITKMGRVEQVLKGDPEKSCFIRIQSSPADDPDFLLDFNIVEISNDAALQKFISDLVRQIVGEVAASPARPPPSGHLYDSIDEDDSGVNTAKFERLKPVLRSENSSWPSVEKAWLEFVPGAEVKDMLGDLEKLSQKQHISDDLPYLSHVTLPGLYKEKDLVSLATLAMSQNPRLRHQALNLATLLLCEQGLRGFSHQQLKSTEAALFRVIEQERFESLDSGLKFRDDLGCTELLVIVYIFVCVLCMMTCDHTESKCLIYVISKRPLFHMKKSGSAPNLASLFRSKTPQAGNASWVKVLGTCFAQWKQKTCAWISQQVYSKLTTLDNQDSNAKLSPELQFPVLVASFIQSYADMSPSRYLGVLRFLHKHSGERLRDPAQRELKRIMISSAVFGLNLFLQHCTEELTSSDNFEEFCKECITYMDKMLKMLDAESRHQCLYRVTSLLFHSNKAVRQYTGILFRQQSFYHENLWTLLHLETDSVLSPLLTFSKQNETELSALESHHRWVILPAMFATKHVRTHLHRPTATNHLRQNSTRDLHQDRYFRELECLKGLQHSSIVELVSYHEQCCPQFYITEDYTTKVLQTVLVNKSKNNSWFSIHKLLQMLVEALEGVQYCHDHGVVHRDLTAASFFISSAGRVKLANFKQSRRLAGKEYIRDFECWFIPTRWSAPESHRFSHFSIASDMWMVAHLLYEVLTHGRMPYVDGLSKTDEDLMPMVVKGEKRLCYEPCIPTGVSSIIQQLTSLRPQDRSLHAAEVISKLKIEISKAADVANESFFFPNLNLPGQAATEHKKGLVMSLVEDYKGPEVAGTGGEDSEIPQIDESGYINFGAHRGLRHFRELCPPDFTAEVWSILTQEMLPGITQMIGHPQLNATGQQELPFAIPAQSLCSLRDAVLTRWLGREIEPYIVCLRQLATIISQLHSQGIILCDFAADTVHIEKFPGNPPKFKVWVTSLPSIKLLQGRNLTECYVRLDLPQGAEKRRRAAGEVLQYGQYSTASDVYCYSVLAWWVFNAFDVTGSADVPTASLSPLEEVPESEIYENVAAAYQKPVLSKPASCPDHIYKHMKECWQSQKHERPCIQILEAYMTLQEPEIPITAESLRQESGAFIDVDNFSEKSDTDSLYADISEVDSYCVSVANHSLRSSQVSDEEEIYADCAVQDDGSACSRSELNVHRVGSFPSGLDRRKIPQMPVGGSSCNAPSEEDVYTALPDFPVSQSEFTVPPLKSNTSRPTSTTAEEPHAGNRQADSSERTQQNSQSKTPPKEKPPVAPKPKVTTSRSPQAGNQGRNQPANKVEEELQAYLAGVSGDSASPASSGATPPPLPPRSYRQHLVSEGSAASGQHATRPAVPSVEECRSGRSGTPPPLPSRTHQHGLPQRSRDTAGSATASGSPRRVPPPPPPNIPLPPPLRCFHPAVQPGAHGHAAGTDSTTAGNNSENRLSQASTGNIYEDL